MPVAESPTSSGDLIFLSFVGGFALATLVFWPLLHRAHNRLAQTSSAPTGRHAHGSEQKKPARSGKTATSVPAAAGDSSATPRTTVNSEGASAESSGAEIAPVKDLFEEYYGPKFDLVRDRLASLRQQINGE